MIGEAIVTRGSHSRVNDLAELTKAHRLHVTCRMTLDTIDPFLLEVATGGDLAHAFQYAQSGAGHGAAAGTAVGTITGGIIGAGSGAVAIPGLGAVPGWLAGAGAGGGLGAVMGGTAGYIGGFGYGLFKNK